MTSNLCRKVKKIFLWCLYLFMITRYYILSLFLRKQKGDRNTATTHKFLLGIEQTDDDNQTDKVINPEYVLSLDSREWYSIAYIPYSIRLFRSYTFISLIGLCCHVWCHHKKCFSSRHVILQDSYQYQHCSIPLQLHPLFVLSRKQNLSTIQSVSKICIPTLIGCI